MEKIIEVKNLSKKFKVPVKQGFVRSIFIPKNKEIVAVDNISFTVERGEAVAFLGPNGAGKTTTLKMLTGLLYPTSGSVKVLETIPVERKYTFLRKIALVMGNKSGLSWDLSARQSFDLFESIYDLDHQEAMKTVGYLAEILEVSKSLDLPIRKLSLGQRLKMELIGAILHSPEIVFLDEPTLGLDVVAKRNIREFLRKTNKEKGTTIILTSHDMADIEKVCNRVIVINHGKIMFDDAIGKLTGRYRGRKYLTLIFTEEVAQEEVEKYGKVIDKKPLTYTIEVAGDEQAKVIAAVSENLPIDDIDITHVPLDEIMADMFGKR
ncbi:TPA: ABC transporter [Candidatus Collierbacteria bacterium]|uniref:ABC transporter related-protein n=1 Tax=Candidatus Collierbacteria bacterium GW2011_GWA2_42_17 TaxID=1618378 RepID=A0A0G0Z2K6_9BACT|nr:MAG: ABC transporter related-protein [Candidatus Collierbacteria bacterium GW2011_GWB2_42_12]KKS43030.1 MAG: ABC transporter related-protein [Candidatus Collierbacteria bacterium GW2011_GWA2_42_17]KKS68080.1 MAG: ABC transporter related-protein [Candidatus Collierbacteria bacterium GW2011_GWA1_42_60]HAI22412.1 ABC transporter [Candidatus Collierbacteria bacterium]HAN22411.1 ABC transporter [Candidatus Collierbacteria bacterium]